MALRRTRARYAIAFLFAYACFFLAVRVWIVDSSLYPADGEGCLTVFALLAAGFVIGGLFMAAGGAPMLLEAAFEAAFAGVVVRRPLAGDLVLGDWATTLLAHTWKQALAAFLALLAVAAVLHAKAPEAATFAEAVRAIFHAR